MTLSHYLSFCVLVFAIVYSPGPMTMFMMANGMKKQHGSFLPVLMGSNNAYLLSIILFTAGLTQLLQKNLMLLKLIQLTGIFYLFYLAYIQWNKKIDLNAAISSVNSTASGYSLYKESAFIALTNPKTILLFSVIFPQFISEGKNRFSQIAILGATFLILQFSSGCTYAYFGQKIRNWIEKPVYQKLVIKLPAIILLVIALFLIGTELIH